MITAPNMQQAGRASTDLGPYLNQQQQQQKTNQYPIAFQHLGKSSSTTHFTLFASSQATRKPWLEKIRLQQEEKNKKSPIFEIIPAVRQHEFVETNKINHFITFSKFTLYINHFIINLKPTLIIDGGQQYLLAADDGVYVGHHNYRYANTTPHKVLSLDKVTQIHAIETTETLLVLADRTLWEYNLDVVNGKPETQPRGRLVQTHVPFFYVGICLKRTMLCVPRISTLKSVITIFEAVKRIDILMTPATATTAATPVATTNLQKRSSGFFMDKLLSIRTLSSSNQISDDLHLKKLKDCYVPCEAYAVELSASMMLITSSRGMIMIDMRTDKPQRKLKNEEVILACFIKYYVVFFTELLNPGDRNLAFILEREKEVTTSLNLRQPIKRIAIFRTPRNHYFICYDGKINNLCVIYFITNVIFVV
jgi:hypothetical protein